MFPLNPITSSEYANPAELPRNQIHFFFSFICIECEPKITGDHIFRGLFFTHLVNNGIQGFWLEFASPDFVSPYAFYRVILIFVFVSIFFNFIYKNQVPFFILQMK